MTQRESMKSKIRQPINVLDLTGIAHVPTVRTLRQFVTQVKRNHERLKRDHDSIRDDHDSLQQDQYQLERRITRLAPAGSFGPQLKSIKPRYRG
jgi:hypothetical protein